MLFSRYLAITLIIAVKLSSSNAQAVVYVTPEGAGNLTGSTWANAISGTALQTCLSTSPAGTTVLVSGGVYKPTSLTGQSARGQSFSIASGIQVQGGYIAGTSKREISPRSSTIFSGDINQSATKTDNCYHVVFFYNASDKTVLDGVVISQGYAYTNGNTGTDENRSGGGIYSLCSSQSQQCRPLIRNCYLTNNEVDFSGAALYNEGINRGECSPQVENCVFIANRANFNGGAVATRINGSTGINKSVFFNCMFINNSAYYGGACFSSAENRAVATIRVINCIFDGNRSVYGGSFSSFGNTIADITNTLVNCTFVRNNANRGAVLYSDSNFQSTIIRNKLINCILFDNYINGSYSNKGYNSFDSYSSGSGVNQFNVDFSLMQPAVADFTGENNIITKVVPVKELTDFTADLELAFDSEAIDKGTTQLYTELPPTDINGSPRIVNGKIDLGAYETTAEALIASIGNGSWIDPGIWSLNRLPNQSEQIRIDHEIVLPSSSGSPFLGRKIILGVNGKIIFAPETTLLLK